MSLIRKTMARDITRTRRELEQTQRELQRAEEISKTNKAGHIYNERWYLTWRVAMLRQDLGRLV